MLKRAILFAAIAFCAMIGSTKSADADTPGQVADWQRFYHYPYVYYPQTFERPQPFDHLYYRYPPSMQIPVYNKGWYNFYPSKKPYHQGNHYRMDIF